MVAWHWPAWAASPADATCATYPPGSSWRSLPRPCEQPRVCPAAEMEKTMINAEKTFTDFMNTWETVGILIMITEYSRLVTRALTSHHSSGRRHLRVGPR